MTVSLDGDAAGVAAVISELRAVTEVEELGFDTESAQRAVLADLDGPAAEEADA